MTAFGIDLGTTRTSIAMVAPFDPSRGWFGSPTVLQLPDGVSTDSAVLFEPDEVVIGAPARNMGNRARDCAAIFKRDMSDNTPFTPTTRNGTSFTPVELSALLLSFVKDNGSRVANMPVERAVITVPAYFGEVERRRTREAGVAAGLEVLDIINEPTAAMLAYLFQPGAETIDEPVLVFDLGGGTFDSVVVDITDTAVRVISIGGDVKLGGRDFDNTVANHLANQFTERYPDAGIPLADSDNEARLLMDVERARETLSSAPQNNVPVWGFGAHASLSVNVKLQREELERVIDGLIERAIEITRTILASAARKNVVPRRVLFVGGTTKTPAIKRRVMAEFDLREVEAGNDPDLLVAKGAAVWAQRLVLVERACAELRMTDLSGVDWTSPGPRALLTALSQETGQHAQVLERLLGLAVQTISSRGYAVRCLDPKTDTPYLWYLIGAQDELPFVGTPQVFTRNGDTTQWVFEIYEDTPENPGAKIPGLARKVEVVRSEAGQQFAKGSSLNLQFSLSPSQIIELHAWNEGDARETGFQAQVQA